MQWYKSRLRSMFQLIYINCQNWVLDHGMDYSIFGSWVHDEVDMHVLSPTVQLQLHCSFNISL